MPIFFAVFFAILAAWFVIRALTAPRLPRYRHDPSYKRRCAAAYAVGGSLYRFNPRHTYTKLGYGSVDAAACYQGPSRIYRGLGH